MADTSIAIKNVLFVMAVEAEYGAHLKERFVPLMTGVGPVEAGVVLGAELGRREARGKLPHLVVSLGSAGSRSLEQTEVYRPWASRREPRPFLTCRRSCRCPTA